MPFVCLLAPLARKYFGFELRLSAGPGRVVRRLSGPCRVSLTGPHVRVRRVRIRRPCALRGEYGRCAIGGSGRYGAMFALLGRCVFILRRGFGAIAVLFGRFYLRIRFSSGTCLLYTSDAADE